MTAIAGKRVRVKSAGLPVAFVADAMTNTGDSKTYQITNAAKRLWDPTIAVLVYYNAVLQAATTYTVNRLSGTITFAAAKGASAVTVSGSYLPLTQFGEAKAFSFSAKGINADEVAFGDSDITRQQVQRTCSGTVSEWWLPQSPIIDLLDFGVLYLIEIAIADGATPAMRAWALFAERAFDAPMAGLQETGLTWNGTPDVDGHSFTFLV